MLYCDDVDAVDAGVNDVRTDYGLMLQNSVMNKLEDQGSRRTPRPSAEWYSIV
jgi:hypothetical protein